MYLSRLTKLRLHVEHLFGENRPIQSFKSANVFAKLAANGLMRVLFSGGCKQEVKAVMSLWVSAAAWLVYILTN